MKPKKTVAVSAVWFRRATGAHGLPIVEVLAEVEGTWRRIGHEMLEGQFSHIVEALGIEGAPEDVLTTQLVEERS